MIDPKTQAFLVQITRALLAYLRKQAHPDVRAVAQRCLNELDAL